VLARVSRHVNEVPAGVECGGTAAANRQLSISEVIDQKWRGGVEFRYHVPPCSPQSEPNQIFRTRLDVGPLLCSRHHGLRQRITAIRRITRPPTPQLSSRFNSRATRARKLLCAASASVLFGLLLVRVRRCSKGFCVCDCDERGPRRGLVSTVYHERGPRGDFGRPFIASAAREGGLWSAARPARKTLFGRLSRARPRRGNFLRASAAKRGLSRAGFGLVNNGPHVAP
jgi:hypothetical protein